MVRFLDEALRKFTNSRPIIDLEDHWAAAVHKAERNHLVQRLQSLGYDKQVRITILSGDVHLAAIGRFFTKAKLNVAQEKDHRYMVNVVSVASIYRNIFRLLNADSELVD
jgi:hypothetical protein